MKLLCHETKFTLVALALLVMFGTACAKSKQPSSAPVPASENKPPVIASVSFPNDVMAQTESIIICVATDPDGDNLKYQWSTEGGTVKGEGNSIVWTAPDSAGRYTIKVVIADGKGGEATHSASIRVVTNADGSNNPIVTLKLSMLSAQPVVEQRRSRIWTTTTINCVVDNAPGVNYKWSATAGKLMGKDIKEETASSVGWIAPGGAGEYTVTVTVTDGKGNEATGQVKFTVFCCTSE
jgi:hypothetical protein